MDRHGLQPRDDMAELQSSSTMKKRLLVKRLDLALELDLQRLALAVQRLASGHFDPAFADAVFLDVAQLLAVEPDAHVMLEALCRFVWNLTNLQRRTRSGIL